MQDAVFRQDIIVQRRDQRGNVLRACLFIVDVILSAALNQLVKTFAVSAGAGFQRNRGFRDQFKNVFRLAVPVQLNIHRNQFAVFDIKEMLRHKRLERTKHIISREFIIKPTNQLSVVQIIVRVIKIKIRNKIVIIVFCKPVPVFFKGRNPPLIIPFFFRSADAGIGKIVVRILGGNPFQPRIGDAVLVSQIIKMTELDFSLQHVSLFNDDMTIATISQDSKISYEQTFTENKNYDESHFEMFDSGDEYNQSGADHITGEKDAFPPKILFESVFGETVDDSLASEAGKWGSDAYRIKGHDKEWSDEILESFRGGKLISGYSALHAVNLAKNGTFDSLTGIEGDGNNMLDVMHGDYSKYEQLSDLAKAAVVTRFCVEHPDMFIGTTENMVKAAEKAGIGLDNPVFARAMSGYQKHCTPYSVRKLDTVKSIMAEKNLSKTMETMAPGDKKKLLKTLMIMQIGGTVPKDILKDNTNETMMSLLAKGNVDIKLPEMNADRLNQFKLFFPEGKEPVANGLSQEFTFGKDSVKISLNGPRGQFESISDCEADLRKVNPAGLNMLLGAMDYLYDKMQDYEINDLYNKLNDPNLGKEALADIIRGFADPDLINEILSLQTIFMVMSLRESVNIQS